MGDKKKKEQKEINEINDMYILGKNVLNDKKNLDFHGLQMEKSYAQWSDKYIEKEKAFNNLLQLNNNMVKYWEKECKNRQEVQEKNMDSKSIKTVFESKIINDLQEKEKKNMQQ